MPIPDYQSIMLPLLKLTSDGTEHTSPEVVEIIGNIFKLTDEEKNQMLPSGTQTIIENRVGWARTYLKYMIDYDIGVSKVRSFDIKRKGSDLFLEESWID